MSALQITPIGRKMLAFPLHPRYARMLLAAQEYGCVHQACLVAALTQGRDLLLRNVDGSDIRPRRFARRKGVVRFLDSDARVELCGAKTNSASMPAASSGIHAVTARQVGPLFEQFLRIAKDEGLDIQAARGQGRGVAKVHSHRLQRPGGAAAGPRHVALRTGP